MLVDQEMNTIPYHEQRMVADTKREFQRVHVVANEKPALILYMRPTCPYCQRVTGYLRSVHKTIPMRDTSKDSQAEKDLVKIGGKKQVPCLVINGKALYESADIIKWLQENQDKY